VKIPRTPSRSTGCHARRGNGGIAACGGVVRLHRLGFREAIVVRSLARPSFFRMFDLLLSTTNPGLKLSRWTHDDVEFERERYSLTGTKHGLAIEIFTLTCTGRRGWSLLVVKEYWWAGPEAEVLKSTRWARPTRGRRSDLMAWLRVQESDLDRSSPRMKLAGN
jgi:hypothetical protein